jgi:hypothetical protein
MFGLILGTLCLIALVATVRRRRYGFYGSGPWHHFAYQRGYHGHGHGPWRHGPSGRTGSPQSFARGLFVRLDTTPGQEKAIVNILRGTGERVHGVKTELSSLRKEVAALFGSDVFEADALATLLREHQAPFERVRAELVQALTAIHEVLDARQRRILSELLADGSLGHALHPLSYGC